MLVGIRPDDVAYEDHTGPNFVSQDDSNNGNVAYYEMTSVGDTIRFDLSRYMSGLENPVATFHTNWGPTEFLLRDQNDVETFINEKSGYHTDLWVVEMGNVSGRTAIEITDDDQGVNGTQAAWLPYVGLIDAEV
jgi:hypothetical protein